MSRSGSHARWSAPRSRIVRALAALATALLAPASILEADTNSPVGPAGDLWRPKVDSSVLEALERFGTTDFLVVLDEQADLGEASRLHTKEAKGRYVFETLRRFAHDRQSPLRAMLASRGIESRGFWIANMVWARGDLGIVEAVAIREDVARVAANPRVLLPQPSSSDKLRATRSATIEASIELLGVPREFWANGFAGEGVVIGGQDTGYDWQHPALKTSYRGWNGATATHDYNWHDAIHSGGGSCGADSTEPCDDGSHGTHTMGTMVGDDGNGNRIGLAPAAKWIGCRNMDQGVGTPATYAECFQWFIAPTDSSGQNPDPTRAPDVINNSWTCPPSEGCTDPNALRLVVENTRAAGILVVASAGNDGPGCSTVSSAISIYDAVLTVGATDIEDDIAQFSGRGSVSVDGSGRIKPDITAPGVDIRSSVPGETYDRFSGTSMAGPHVAGMAALALSAAECTRGRPRKLERHLLDSALPRAAPELCGESSHASDPNNSYGHGILRAVLPACRLDGRIFGKSDSVAASRVICRNRTAGRKTTLRPGGLSTWNCMASGLAALAGDTIQLKLTGAAVDGEAVRGRLEGLEADKLRCLNRTSGASVRAAVDQRRRWSCSAAGLEAAPGDRLKIIITGRALADS